jgi:hypothetical protein
MKNIDIKAMLEFGANPETIHSFHGNTMSCTLCEIEKFNKDLNLGGKKLSFEWE